MSSQAESPLKSFLNKFEETVIALILGVMVVVTFINVVLRYGFNTGLIWTCRGIVPLL